MRNVLHTPSLCGPLYPLCRHRLRPGCSTFSFHDVDSYILFPPFTLEIDDSIDNVISYETVGPGYDGEIDYVKPRFSPSILPAVDTSTFVVSPAPGSAPTPVHPPHAVPPDNASACVSISSVVSTASALASKSDTMLRNLVETISLAST